VRVAIITRNDYQMYMRKYRLHDHNDKIVFISEFYEVSVGVYIVSGGGVTQLPTLGQDETEGNMYISVVT
jgi:hypothetical protein